MKKPLKSNIPESIRLQLQGRQNKPLKRKKKAIFHKTNSVLDSLDISSGNLAGIHRAHIDMMPKKTKQTTILRKTGRNYENSIETSKPAPGRDRTQMIANAQVKMSGETFISQPCVPSRDNLSELDNFDDFEETIKEIEERKRLVIRYNTSVGEVPPELLTEIDFKESKLQREYPQRYMQYKNKFSH
ncbi:hypothetical protein PCE1_002768 [Barthelona sp. PCE]